MKKNNTGQKQTWLRRNISLRNLFIFFIPVSIAILLIMLYNLSISVEHLSVSLVKESADEAILSVHSRIDPVVETVKSIGSWEFDDINEIQNMEELNARLIPAILQSDQISSMMIAAKDGTEYMLLNAGGQWNNRLTRPDADTLISKRYLWEYRPYQADCLIESWVEKVKYDPRTRTWFTGALSQSGPNQISWTDPYIFFTTKEPGITASVYSFSSKGDTIVTAFDVLLKDINRISQSIELTPNGLALILTGDHQQVAGLPHKERFIHPDSMNRYILQHPDELGIPVLIESLRQWEGLKAIEEPFQFNFNRQTWWAGIIPIRTEESEPILYSVILVPESDFLAEMNRTRLVIIGGFTLVLVLTILIIRAYNQIRKTNALLAQKNRKIENQKLEIELKNKEITDSIIYAERIQMAVMPAEQKVNKILPESFVLFLPKDIVSGDFYWIEKRNNITMFAAVDCTGHGVPGAFVSIVGHGGLNQAVREHKLTDTDRIINRLNSVVTETFQKSINEEIKDGMDMALCALNTDDMILQYSGAKNPMYLIRRNDSPLIVDDKNHDPSMTGEHGILYEIKADRMGVEPREDTPDFSRHEIRVQHGDLVYLFSDGLPDQFGGAKNKKFTYKRLREKLLSIADMNLNEQEADMKNTINDWRGNNEQIDDILVMGILIQ